MASIRRHTTAMNSNFSIDSSKPRKACNGAIAMFAIAAFAASEKTEA
jgi:hypothetical protein